MKKAMLQLHTAIFLAGFTAILGKLITLEAASLVWWRLLVTILSLVVYLKLSRKKLDLRVPLIVSVMGVGAIVGIHWVCFFGSVKFANVSIALVCFSSSGFFSSLLEPLIERRRLSLFELGLGILSMGGIYIIFHFDTKYKLGIALGVAGAALSALFSIYNKRLVRHMDGMSMTIFEMAGAFIMLSLLLPFAVAGGNNFWPQQLDWLWLLILSLLCTVWAYILQFKALRHFSAFTLNLSYNLEPVYGILLAFLIFKENEHLSGTFYLGVAFILFAIGIQMFSIRQKHLKTLSPAIKSE